MSDAHPTPWHLVRKPRAQPRVGYNLLIVDAQGLVVLHGIEPHREATAQQIVDAVNDVAGVRR